MNDKIPLWVWLMGIGLLLFTIICFGIMLLGML
jgi:purine-cytosine permease-like protein